MISSSSVDQINSPCSSASETYHSSSSSSSSTHSTLVSSSFDNNSQLAAPIIDHQQAALDLIITSHRDEEAAYNPRQSRSRRTSVTTSTSTSTIKPIQPSGMTKPLNDHHTYQEQAKRTTLTPTSGVKLIILVITISLVLFWIDDHSFLFLSSPSLLAGSPADPQRPHQEERVASGEDDDEARMKLDYKLLGPANQTGWEEEGWTVVLLHGLGDYEASESLRIRNTLLRLRPGLFAQTRFVIPVAPQLPITVFDGHSRSAWFDIASWNDLHLRQDRTHMLRNVRALARLLRDTKLVLSRTILAGFSQGAVMSLLLGLSLHEDPPAGIIMLSGYVPKLSELEGLIARGKEGREASEGRTAVLHWLHGARDPYLTLGLARKGFQTLVGLDSFAHLRFDALPHLDHHWSIPELRALIPTFQGLFHPEPQAS